MRWRSRVTDVAKITVALGMTAIPSLVCGENIILEDFESYAISGLPEGVTEGANYLSSGGDMSIHHIGPTWNRFGDAIADGVFVSNHTAEVLSGEQSGTLFADWTQGSQASGVYLTDGIDVTTHSGYRIDLRSNGSTGTQGAGVVAIFSGTVAGQSQAWVTDLTKVNAQSVTGSIQTFHFDFNPDDFIETNVFAWDADFYGALSNLDWIGIQIVKGSSIGEEGFSIDNLVLSPEPGSAAILVGGALLLVRRRRRATTLCTVH